MLARALLLALALSAPLAASAVPALPATEDEFVSSHGAYDPYTGASCSSSDPLTGIASTDLTSRMSVTPASAGVRTFTVHLDATLDDPVNGNPGCGAIDLALESTLAWPPESGWNGAGFTSPCGVSGFLVVYDSGTSRHFQTYFSGASVSCGLPFEAGFLGWTTTPLHPQTAAACTPIVVAACGGAYAQSEPGWGCGGSAAQTLYVAAGITVASVRRSCHYWSDGQEHVVVSDGIGLVQVDTTSTSCQIIVSDPLGLAGTASAPCPEEVRALVYGTDWTHLLP